MSSNAEVQQQLTKLALLPFPKCRTYNPTVCPSNHSQSLLHLRPDREYIALPVSPRLERMGTEAFAVAPDAGHQPNQMPARHSSHPVRHTANSKTSSDRLAPSYRGEARVGRQSPAEGVVHAGLAPHMLMDSISPHEACLPPAFRTLQFPSSLSCSPVPDQSAPPLLKHLTVGVQASRRKGGEGVAELKTNLEVER